jgi:PAS domain S-box-containing protein
MPDTLPLSFMMKGSLSTHEDLARFIADISIGLMNVDGEEINAKIEGVLQTVSDAVGMERCDILQFSGEGRGIYRSHASKKSLGKILLDLEDGDASWLQAKIGRLCQKDIPQVGLFSPTIVHEKRFLKRLGLSSGLIVPLKAKKTPLGFLCCGSENGRTHPPSRVESTFLGVVARMVANVLEHRKANDSLESSERKMQKLIERLSDDYFFYRHDTKGIFTYVSDSVTNVLGYSRKELLGHYGKYLTESPVNKRAERATQLSIKGIRQDPYEVEIYHKNGDIITLEVQEISVEYEGGKVVAVEGIAHNITKRKKYEELIRSQKDELERMVRERTAKLDRINTQLVQKINQYEAAKKKIDLLVGELEVILDSVPAAIFYKDVQHRFIRVNQSFARFFGKDKENLKGKTYFDLGFGRYSAEEFTREDEHVMETGLAKRQTVCKVVVNNVPKWLVIDKIPYRDINGKIIGIIGFALDISDFKNAEKLIFFSE